MPVQVGSLLLVATHLEGKSRAVAPREALCVVRLRRLLFIASVFAAVAGGLLAKGFISVYGDLPLWYPLLFVPLAMTLAVSWVRIAIANRRRFGSDDHDRSESL